MLLPNHQRRARTVQSKPSSMPRIVQVVIRPDVSHTERDQNVDGLVQQLKLYYCHTREESLRKLAATLEDQAFRHSETRDQYSYQLESLSSQEFEKATQLHVEINACVPPIGQGFGLNQALVAERVGTNITQWEANLSGGKGEGYDLEKNASTNDKKAKQQMARRKIMTRRRKRTQSAGRGDLVTQLQAPETLEKPTSIEAECSGAFVFGLQHDGDKRGVKRCKTGEQDAGTGVAEWIDQFCNGNVDADNVGLSFLEDLPQDTFGFEENNDMETCFSSSLSSESEASARKRRKLAEENSK